MAKEKPKSAQKEAWPPESLKKFFDNKLKQVSPLGQTHKDALERLLVPADVGLTSAYNTLCDKHDQQLILKYLEDVCDAYLDIEMYKPIRTIEYKEWLRKISRKSAELADTVREFPSPDLTIPAGLSNVHSLLAALLEGYGDEFSIDEYASVGKTLSRSLQQIPISMLLRQLAALANEEVSRPPNHYWEMELGIMASKKQGNDGAIGREQILIKVIKKLTHEYFKAPYHELVATLVNTLIGSVKHSGDSISKTPK